MKEFGLYKLKEKYVTDFASLDNSLVGLKIRQRPFICIKVDNQNWLVPIASLNPTDYNYRNKVERYSNFANLDKRTDNRAIHIFNDLTGLHFDPKFKSVVQYYNAIPVKHEYCNKYRDKKCSHIVIKGRELKGLIKSTLIKALKEKKKGREVGFIKAKIEAGENHYKEFGKKSFAIHKELYKDHFALLALQKESSVENTVRAGQSVINKAIKQAIKNSSATVEQIQGSLLFCELDAPLQCYPISHHNNNYTTKNSQGELCVRIKPSVSGVDQRSAVLVPLKLVKVNKISNDVFVTHADFSVIANFQLKTKILQKSGKHL